MKYELCHIHADAKIAEDVKIDPFVTIKGDVEIGSGTWIGPHVTIMDGVRIGKNCKIFPGAVVGSIPQDLKYQGEESLLIIEDNVSIREYCTLNRGTKANFETRIKENSLLMAYVHVAHDCIVGRNCILANNVNLAGHIELGDYAILGGLTAVHQFVKIGAHAMIGGASLVRKDVPPFVRVAREPLSYIGVNYIGLKRRGFTSEQVNHIQDIYRQIFVMSNNASLGVKAVKEQIPDSPERKTILEFIEKADRGMVKSFRQINGKK